jgi:hypothetical protein
MQWYGHVVRMQDYRKPKQAIEARRERRRGRGRTRKTWEDCDRCGQEKRKNICRTEETGSRWKWTEDPTLQGNKDEDEELSKSLPGVLPYVGYDFCLLCPSQFSVLAE